jgi:hypothetical protein
MPTPVLIIRKKDDPIAIRASIGGQDGTGYYCIYRGERKAIIEMVEKVLLTLRYAPDEPEPDDDTGG